MSAHLIPIVFAANIGDLIWVVAMVIAFIGWLLKQVSGASQQQRPAAQRPPQRPVRPAERRLQDEIDSFLEQASASQTGESASIEIREFEELPPPKPAKVRVREQVLPENVFAGEPRPPKPGANIQRRKKPGSGGLGQGVREHVAEHMHERVTAQVEQDIGQSVRHSVSHNLGDFAAEKRTSTAVPPLAAAQVAAAASAAQLRELLSRPAGVRQAILAGEILSRPIALRRPKFFVTAKN